MQCRLDYYGHFNALGVICGISTYRYRHLTTSFCLLVQLCLGSKIHR